MYGICMCVCKHVAQVDLGMCIAHGVYGVWYVVAYYECVCRMCVWLVVA